MRLREALGKGCAAHSGSHGEAFDGMRRPRVFENLDDRPRQPLIPEQGEKRRRRVTAMEMLAQQQDQALFHESLGHRLRTNARVGDFREHQLERALKDIAGRQVLHERLAKAVEEPDPTA
jgi:hypothetical protein